MAKKNQLSDDELIEELRFRFNENKMNLIELQEVSKRLEKVNKKLTESESLKGHFLSNIRNEINNPLTAILGLSKNLMQKEKIKPDMVRHLASLIHTEAFNLDFQLRTIFAAAEIEAGEVQLHLANVDLERLIQKIIDSFQIHANEKGIHIHFENHLFQDHGPHHCQIDSEKVALILSNLIGNAVEFSHPQGEICIKLGSKDDSIFIAVEDNGIGIIQSDHDRIFDRFIQLDTGTAKQHRGQGLGLSVVKSMLQFIRGKIDLESSPKSGTVFTISIPVSYSYETIETFAEADNEEVF
ncbi:sensor histidine kinase [bacterium]